jgi:hypothetical protein
MLRIDGVRTHTQARVKVHKQHSLKHNIGLYILVQSHDLGRRLQPRLVIELQKSYGSSVKNT